MALLNVKNLSVHFYNEGKYFSAVDEVSYKVEQGEILGIVGESGSGKSVSSLAIMGLIDPPAQIKAETLTFDGIDLLNIKHNQRQSILGSGIAMIFQDPISSLNPCYTIGYQIIETLKVHSKGDKIDFEKRAIELLEQVGIPDPKSRLKAYPHQLSGGMCQRVGIAIAIACNPKLLIADEPTTALDVTIQSQIVDLLVELQRKNKMSLIFITHDIALLSTIAERIVVMYAGQIVETGPIPDIIRNPRHPYTQALLQCLPEFGNPGSKLNTLRGLVPGIDDRPKGCLLNPRCPYVQIKCQNVEPQLKPYESHEVKCHFPLDDEGRPLERF